MSVKINGGFQEMEFYFSWEPRGAGKRLMIDDRFAARSMLARLHARGDGLMLRRLALSPFPGASLDDNALLDQLAGWIASGKIRIAVAPMMPLSSVGEEGEAAPYTPEVPWNTPAPMEPEVFVEEPLPPVSTDMRLQAEALKHAAKDGKPFCEECEKANQQAKEKEVEDAALLDKAAQAATLRHAAASGIPFCEECARATAAKKS